MIKITDGWFRLAGTIYKWPYTDKRGVGVPKDEFFKDYIEVEVEGKLYKVEGKKALEEVRKYKSYHSAKGLPLGVIPKAILEEIENELQNKLDL